MTSHPASPYKGLRFYTADDSSIFAARGLDAARCAQLLAGPASVLMLHGRTGCGKSSFLRAALKQFLERAQTGLWFASGSQTFVVVRSGLTPLRELAGAVFDAAHQLKKSPHASVGDVGKVLRQYQSEEQRSAFVDECSDSVEEMTDVISALGEAAPGTPILVIDQAEEVFTLRERGDGGAAGSPQPPESAAPDLDAVRARVDYMNLLRTVAEEPLGVKVLISLRTEYKGLFEDELRRGMGPEASTRLTGFHLNELDKPGLIEAIVHPTEVGAGEKGKAGIYRFTYDPKVAETIAEKLLDTDAVPMGGVLPTLQVVCSRLYEQTYESKGRRTAGAWQIEMTDLERLGKLDDQVEVYLREQLEEMFRKRSSPDVVEVDRTRDIDQWYGLLEQLVRLQGDGRAVTRWLSQQELQDKNDKKFKCRFFDDFALNHLLDVGVLRREPRDKTYWTLGHDSLGLAIHKWAITYKESVVPAMRMDINSPRNAATLTRARLFPDDDSIEDTKPFPVTVPADNLWDHQIAFFAQARKLSERIGITFKSSGSSMQLTPPPTSPRVLVSADRALFPAPADRNAWTDIAVSNLFQGNGLVGPIVKGLEPLRTVETGDDSIEKLAAAKEELVKRLKTILDHLVNVRATVLAYDKSTPSFMRLASLLAGQSPDLVDGLDIRYYKKHTSATSSQADDEQGTGATSGQVEDEKRTSATSSKEELFEELARHGHHESVFMVGTAYGRALAGHRGYRTYFDCQDLSRYFDILDKLKGRSDVKVLADLESRPEARSELFRLYQDVFSHTVWQLNIPPSEWRRIEHYPLVMRAAALCYFTADYIRSFPDDFVRHLYDWHANTFLPEDRVSRETIRQMLQDCFQFLTFDENPRLLFDPDSKFEFSPREGTLKLSSTVASIHAELTACRKRTVDVFGRMCEQLDQLERHGKDSRGDDTLRKAEVLRGYAWANFRIYNYYDSARLMEQALLLVSKVVGETTRQIWKAEADQADLEAEADKADLEAEADKATSTLGPVQST